MRLTGSWSRTPGWSSGRRSSVIVTPELDGLHWGLTRPEVSETHSSFRLTQKEEIENPFINTFYIYSLLANQHRHAKISAKYKPLRYGGV